MKDKFKPIKLTPKRSTLEEWKKTTSDAMGKPYPEDGKMELTPEQEEKFRKAAEILHRNMKECEQFRGRDGI